MIWHGFSRTLVFGAVAAIGWPAAALLLTGVFAASDALAVYLVGVAAVYLAGLGAWPRRALGNGLLGLALGVGVLVLAPGIPSVAAGAAAIVGIGRFRLFGAGRPARDLAWELGSLGLGLWIARTLAGPTPLEVALAIWAFFLVQSLYFLAPGLRRRAISRDPIDPFELAVSRAEALLEGSRP